MLNDDVCKYDPRRSYFNRSVLLRLKPKADDGSSMCLHVGGSFRLATYSCIASMLPSCVNCVYYFYRVPPRPELSCPVCPNDFPSGPWDMPESQVLGVPDGNSKCNHMAFWANLPHWKDTCNVAVRLQSCPSHLW